MKTLKISEATHKELLELQAKIYKSEGVKLTLNEVINGLLIMRERYIDGKLK